MTHHSKAKDVDNQHLSILSEISIDFGFCLFLWLCRWSWTLFIKFTDWAEFWICYNLSLRHSNAVSLVASRCVDDERQRNMLSRKKLSHHPCVRGPRCKIPHETNSLLLRCKRRLEHSAKHKNTRFSSHCG